MEQCNISVQTLTLCLPSTWFAQMNADGFAEMNTDETEEISHRAWRQQRNEEIHRLRETMEPKERERMDSVRESINQQHRVCVLFLFFWFGSALIGAIVSSHVHGLTLRALYWFGGSFLFPPLLFVARCVYGRFRDE